MPVALLAVRVLALVADVVHAVVDALVLVSVVPRGLVGVVLGAFAVGATQQGEVAGDGAARKVGVGALVIVALPVLADGAVEGRRGPQQAGGGEEEAGNLHGAGEGICGGPGKQTVGGRGWQEKDAETMSVLCDG